MKQIIHILIICLAVIYSCKKDVIKYELSTTIIPSEGGIVSPDSGLYNEGSNVIITATPSSEYLFIGWSDGASGTQNPLTISMNSNKPITANFEKRKYPLTLTIQGDGTISEVILPNLKSSDYPSGTIVKLTAIPNTGSEFVAWIGDFQGSDNPVNIIVDKPKTITATFKKSPIRFISRAPVYTYPNNTVGQIKK